jgi:hypothetical protein
VGARFSAPVQTGPGAHPASCTTGTGSFPGVKSGRGVKLTHHSPSSAVGHWIVKLYLYSPYGPYGLYRASVSVLGCTLPYFTLSYLHHIYVSWVLICTTFICLMSSHLHHVYLSHEFPFAPHLSVSWVPICTTFLCLMSSHLHHIYLSHEFPFAPYLSVSCVSICTTFICLIHQKISLWYPLYLKAHWLCVCLCVCAYMCRMLQQESAILGSAFFSSIYFDETKINFIRHQNVNGENSEGRNKEQ